MPRPFGGCREDERHSAVWSVCLMSFSERLTSRLKKKPSMVKCYDGLHAAVVEHDRLQVRQGGIVA